jgi:nitrogen fixation NifU-like protein
MTPADPYNDEVRRCFENPVHAGDLEASYARVLRSGAAAPGEGTRLELTAGIEDDRVAALRFRAWGCPHLIAAAEWYCGALEGAKVGDLGIVDVNEIMERLSVPVDKTGRILLLEDAARSLADGAGGT